jgi:hypothetical protein
MFWIFPGITLIVGLLACLLGCEKTQPAPPPAKTNFPREAPPERVGKKSPEAILKTLHHAAQEMALDGFQFDKSELSWPFDCHAPNSPGYLRLLVDKGYLAAQDLVFFKEVEIANLSDSDPGGTIFAKITHEEKVIFVRKDGLITNSSSPIPPREPAWLP